MNYLGHAYLSFNNRDLLTGNMIADHVKGRLALQKYPAAISRGIEVHRKIDAFTDSHPATQRAKLFFRADYGLYAGPVVDTIFDHFLANDPKLFTTEKDLLVFTENVYDQLQQNRQYFPAAFAGYFEHMKTHNWLYNYRNLKGMERALNGLVRRAKHMPPADKAYHTLITGYYQLNQCYYEFIDDVIKFVKIELEH